MREITTTNQNQVSADYLEQVLLLKLDFSDPAYIHSSFGELVFDGNTYIGVGDFGAISTLREQAKLGPAPLELALSGVNPLLIQESLDSTEYRATVTLYEGYRQDDGTLADDPWVVWSGWWEHASMSLGANNAIRATAQHDLSILNEKDGSRYSDEDQQQLYSGDVGFEFTPYMADLQLAWAGGRASSVIGGPLVPVDGTYTPDPEAPERPAL